MTWVGEQSRAKRVLLGWVALKGHGRGYPTAFDWISAVGISAAASLCSLPTRPRLASLVIGLPPMSSNHLQRQVPAYLGLGGRPVTSAASPGRVGVRQRDTAADIPSPDIQSNAVGYPRPCPFRAAHPSGTRSARDRSPTQVSTRTHNQVQHQLILVHC